MIENPLISVIIPTFNRADKIEQAIKSVVSQTYSNVQLIVVDDGSTDNTAQVIKNYSCEYLVIEHAGQAAARNKGLELAKGSIIASLDSDDIWNDDFLERCLNKMEKDNLDFVFANFRQLKLDGSWENNFLKMTYLKPFFESAGSSWIPLTPNETRRLFVNTCPSPSSSLLIRRSSLVSKWNEELNIADDWCLIIDMVVAKECKAAFTMDILWTKRIDNINIYDGRERFDVIRLLHVEDTAKMLVRYQNDLTKDEAGIIKRRYAVNLLRLSMHYFKHKYDFKTGFGLLRKAIAVNPSFVFKELPLMFIRGSRRHLNTVLYL